MGRSRNRVYDPEYPYFITSSVVEGYPLFAIPAATQIVLDALLFLQEKRNTRLYAYVIMENHIHLVLQSDELPSRMQAFKSWTARAIIDLLTDNGHYLHLSKLRKAKNPSHTDSVHQFWQEGYHPKHIYGDRMMIQKIEYIHQNPVKRGYVDREEEWRYSSARNYLGLDALIPITLFDL
jgi:putative transposase